MRRKFSLSFHVTYLFFFPFISPYSSLMCFLSTDQFAWQCASQERKKERNWEEPLSQVFFRQSDIKSETVQCIILPTPSHFNQHIYLEELWDTQSYFQNLICIIVLILYEYGDMWSDKRFFLISKLPYKFYKDIRIKHLQIYI